MTRVTVLSTKSLIDQVTGVEELPEQNWVVSELECLTDEVSKGMRLSHPVGGCGRLLHTVPDEIARDIHHLIAESGPNAGARMSQVLCRPMEKAGPKRALGRCGRTTGSAAAASIPAAFSDSAVRSSNQASWFCTRDWAIVRSSSRACSLGCGAVTGTAYRSMCAQCTTDE